MTKKEILDAFVLITFNYTGDEGKFDPEAHLRVVGYCDESITVTDGEKTETLSWDEVQNEVCSADEADVNAVTNSFGIYIMEVETNSGCDCGECDPNEKCKGLMFCSTNPNRKPNNIKDDFLDECQMLSGVGAQYLGRLAKNKDELVQKYVEVCVMPKMEAEAKMRRMRNGGNPMEALAALLGGGRRNKPAGL